METKVMPPHATLYYGLYSPEPQGFLAVGTGALASARRIMISLGLLLVVMALVH